MMGESDMEQRDIDYLTRRLAYCRAKAAEVDDVAVARAHRMMAERYEQILATG